MTPEEYEIQMYRLVFGNPNGIKVLTHLLTNMGYFKENLDADEVPVANFAKKILRYCGITPMPDTNQGFSQDRREAIVQSMMSLPTGEKSENRN